MVGCEFAKPCDTCPSARRKFFVGTGVEIVQLDECGRLLATIGHRGLLSSYYKMSVLDPRAIAEDLPELSDAISACEGPVDMRLRKKGVLGILGVKKVVKACPPLKNLRADRLLRAINKDTSK